MTITHIIVPRGHGKTFFYAQHAMYANDPHDMDMLEEVEDLTDTGSESNGGEPTNNYNS